MTPGMLRSSACPAGISENADSERSNQSPRMVLRANTAHTGGSGRSVMLSTHHDDHATAPDLATDCRGRARRTVPVAVTACRPDYPAGRRCTLLYGHRPHRYSERLSPSARPPVRETAWRSAAASPGPARSVRRVWARRAQVRRVRAHPGRVRQTRGQARPEPQARVSAQRTPRCVAHRHGRRAASPGPLCRS